MFVVSVCLFVCGIELLISFFVVVLFRSVYRQLESEIGFAESDMEWVGYGHIYIFFF